MIEKALLAVIGLAALTALTLMGVHHHVVVEPPQVAEYREAAANAKIPVIQA